MKRVSRSAARYSGFDSFLYCLATCKEKIGLSFHYFGLLRHFFLFCVLVDNGPHGT